MNIALLAIIFLVVGSAFLAGLSWLTRKFNINQYLAAAIGVIILGFGVYFGFKAWF